MKWFLLGSIALLVTGCASYGQVANEPIDPASGSKKYSVEEFETRWETNENALILAFSGGGTRAAALAYGVLKELRDTEVATSNGSIRLLDEVHTISSVSGGSFTAAYFALHGDRMFEDYEEVFLRKDVEAALLRRLLNPFSWFSSLGRTEMAIKYYTEEIFGDATFADMLRPGAPLVLINAADFAGGLRFSFVQEYFDLLCSDLSSFPVARAVTASSAVPVVFNPVVVENYSGCEALSKDRLAELQDYVREHPDLKMTVDGMTSYAEREQRKYIHFVDGGITDNLGLRAFYDAVELSGGIKRYANKMNRQTPRRVAIISVNAATDSGVTMDHTKKQPSAAEAMSAMSNVQLLRYSADTQVLVEASLKRWAREWSTPEQPVEPYFIKLQFTGVDDPQVLERLNLMPTSFSLSDEQVDTLIATGAQLLRDNPEFRRMMADVAADSASPGR